MNAGAGRRAAERRGRRAEDFAALLLLFKGYRILGRRLRNGAGEVDLVARSPSGILCFVEVKARASSDDAVGAVGDRQRARIARAAELYLAAWPQLGHKGVRFDIITVAPGRWPRHHPDAWRPG